jgi:RNA-splicing ligase RtcB
MSDEKIRLLFDESFDPDEKLIASLREIAGIDDVHMVVGMVDLHLKKNTENPSSVAIATREKFIPKLSSVAQNCGMALASTNLDMNDSMTGRLEDLFARMRAEDDSIMTRPVMSVEDMRSAACLGAPWAAENAGLPGEFTENVEFGGAVGGKKLLPWDRMNRLVPRYSLDRGRYGFAVIPAGNHFLEIQVVDEVIDGEECRRQGIRENGVMVMMHSDGGLISDDIGNLYGNRTTAKGLIRAFYNLRKTALHLRDRRGREDWKLKREYYWGSDKYIQIDPGTDEGKRYLEAKDLSMNAGYASRVTTMGRIRRLMGEVFPEGPFEMRLLCDFSHNSIFNETVDGRPMWVHRHNACRVVEGQLVFLPGYANTSSYVCIGSGGAGAGYRYLWKGRLARAREKITAG